MGPEEVEEVGLKLEEEEVEVIQSVKEEAEVVVNQWVVVGAWGWVLAEEKEEEIDNYLHCCLKFGSLKQSLYCFD